MSIKLIENEIKRFLASKDPEVLSITGRWGVGKTFAWKKYLEEAANIKRVALDRYSYVSLFGITSLDELKYAVFENSIKSSDIGVEPSLGTLQSNISAAINTATRKLTTAAQKTPILKNYAGGIAPVWYASVNHTVVCIDDFERKGESLAVREVLGLINNLKEIKGCKVCLILNDEALEKEGIEFRKFLEKVVDTTLKFTPSPEECAQIALTAGDDVSKLLAEDIVKLGISNIRVIKKIEGCVRRVRPLLTNFDPFILRQAVHSLTLFGWSIYEPTMSPAIEFLEKRTTPDFLLTEKEQPASDQQVAWNALLRAYDFGSIDQFDLALLSGIRNGFFDPSLIVLTASEMNDRIRAGSLDRAFMSAWERLHDSFDNNQTQTLDEMYESFFEAVRYVTPANLSSTVTLFKELGRTAQATEMLQHYLKSRSEQPEVFNLKQSVFGEDVRDPDVIEAFNRKYASFKQAKTDPAAILLRIHKTDSWNPEDITTLSRLSVEDYRSMFKVYKGYDLRVLISVCLQFDRIGNATTEMKEISKLTKDALRIIGRESQINARRVKTYGVDAEPGPKENES